MHDAIQMVMSGLHPSEVTDDLLYSTDFVPLGVGAFRSHIERSYSEEGISTNGGSFGEILCYEIHSQPHNGRGCHETGLTFKELAQKWEISVSFLGALIEDHCKKLEA